MDERSLLTLLQKRPNEGMKELMRQYMGYCYYIVRNKLAEFPQEDIEECVSDVFVDAYRYREKIDLERGGFRVFLASLRVGGRQIATGKGRKICLCTKKYRRIRRRYPLRTGKCCFKQFVPWE